VVWLFVRSTLAQLVVGVIAGLGGALAAGRLLQDLTVKTNPRDPLTLAVVAALTIIVALAASVVPARRAARADPVIALRYE
jgi:ABC-type antimicrobial peptide transport system permease subunit